MKNKPPKFANWLLKKTLRQYHQASALGDLEEEFDFICDESDISSAKKWYWKQVFKSIPHFINHLIYWSMAMIKNYFKITLRNLKRKKTFSIINIGGLAISLSLSLLIIQILFSMYSSDRFHENKERIYRVVTYQPVGDPNFRDIANAPMPLASELKSMPEVAEVVKIKRGFSGNVVFKDTKLSLSGYYTGPSFLKTFNFKLESGNPETVLNKPFSIVLTKEAAIKFFGNENPVGKTLNFSDYGEFIVTGIMEDVSKLNTHFNFECLISLNTALSLEKQNLLTSNMENWNQFSSNYIYFMLNENSNPENIAQAFPGIIKKNYPDNNETPYFTLQALTDISPGKLFSNEIGFVVPFQLTFVFIFVGLIILLTASFNYTNLSVAKALSRAKEVGIRKVMGANRFQLFFQFISEAVVISLIALILGIILLQFIKPAFLSLNSEVSLFFKLENMHSYGLYIAFIIFSIFNGIFAGFFPALYVSKFNPAMVLKDISKIKLFSNFSLRKGLVIFQFSLSLVFLITSIVGYSQINFLKNRDYGFKSENIINVRLKGVKYPVFKQAIGNYANIENISGCGIVPNLGAYWPATAKLQNAADSTHIHIIPVDENFIENLELKLLYGKNFPQITTSGNEKFVIINETAAKSFGFDKPSNALEQSITFDGKKFLIIIGILKDFSHQNFDSPIAPLALRLIPGDMSYANVKIKNNNKEETIRYIEKQWDKLNPEQAFNYSFYDRQIENSFFGIDTVFKIFGFIAFLAIFITFFGLLGMVIFDTESRIKEIGIRKVMGASIFNIITVIAKSFLKLLLIAVVIASPIAWLLNSLFLQNMAFKINLGFGVFAFGISLMFIIGLIVILPQTIKAALSNPVESLKNE
ncbi:MAG: ABC transporter permease [Calditrichia bacterium]|nr:ABC transporter permease [Calditrichia bacterium]